MPTGGYHPSPERYGGGTPLLQRILEALNRAEGTGFDVIRGSSVWAENMAIARCLMNAWNTNRRLANQFDPTRVTCFLSRWEKFCGLTVLPDDTEAERRARLAAHFLKIGKAHPYQDIKDRLTEAMGSVFVDLKHIPLADAVQWWPGGTPNADSPWYTTTAHVLIKTQKPTGYTELDFNNAVDKIQPIMDQLAPAWLTWDWYRNGGVGTGVWAEDTGAGFWLADGTNATTYAASEQNIGYEIFDG